LEISQAFSATAMAKFLGEHCSRRVRASIGLDAVRVIVATPPSSSIGQKRKSN
jgi:hypothetical protein